MSEAVKLTPAQQAAAVDRIGESIALVSGAGCGKTFVLARRFTELLLASDRDEGEALSSLVALTFTEKAALEMSQRVRAMLTDLADSAQGPDHLRLLRWVDELPQAHISTIHGFCSTVLRSRAVEAGVDPNFAVCADGLMVSRLVAEAADRALLAAIEDQRDDAAMLMESYSFDRVVEAIGVLMDQRTAFPAEQYTGAEQIFQRWETHVERMRADAWLRMDGDADLRKMLDDLAAVDCASDADKLLPLRDDLLDTGGWILTDHRERTAESFALVAAIRPRNFGSDKNWGAEKGAAKRVRDAMKGVMAAVEAYAPFVEEPGEQDRRAAETLAALMTLAGEAGTLYAADKRSRGLLDFTDLLERTERLLTRPAVRKALGERISQLLIDECQDTDAFQVSLLSNLVYAGDDDPAGLAPPGRLFVVGDAKQSIYRFRGAQVEVFGQMCDRMGPGHTESLDRSFRTHAAGVAFVNDLFGSLMGEDYSPIEAYRTTCPDAPSVEILLARGSDGSIARASQATAAQAAVTAQRIREMLDGDERIVWDREGEQWRPVRPGDIAILFARMTNSLEYERELQRRGVPYYVVAGSGFFRRQEVLDVLNALAVVDNAFDDVAWVGVLRSSLFGLDDNAMMHLAETVDAPYLPALTAAVAAGRLEELLAARLGEARLATLRQAVELLGELGKCKDAVGADEIVERLLAATGYEATLLAQGQGKRMVGNVRLLLDQARSAAQSGTALADFLTQMKDLVLHEGRYEQAAVAGEADDVVRIMTIHKAKGLEFPVVVLPDLNAARQVRRNDLLIRNDWGVTWTPAARTDAPDAPDGDGDEDGGDDARPLSARLAWTLEDRDQRAEDIRKWYVAATRHEDHLVLVGADWRGRDGRFRNGDCFLAQMDDHLGLADALSEAGDGGESDATQTIPYADGQYAATLRCMTARPAPPLRADSPPPGRLLLNAATDGADLARAILAAGGARDAAPPLVGPVSADVGAVSVAVSTLGEFERCEMHYHWRYNLRVPALAAPGPDARSGAPASPLDPATLGTMYHRCMELLDVSDPQPAGRLVQHAAAEMDLLAAPGLDLVTREFDAMLAGFRGHDLSPALAAARVDLRELDFEMQIGPALLRGQIDLLFQDADGAWHIVDYKSDRVGPDDVDAHGQHYDLQMLTYALAASKHLGEPVADATLYFLRPAAVSVIDTSPANIARAEHRIATITHRLITARRTAQYQRCDESQCAGCSYHPFCRSAE